MVETIVPVVHGSRARYRLSVTLHTLGAGLSGAAVGSLLGTIGMLLGAPWGGPGLVAVAAVASVYFLREAARLPFPLPNRKAQVPEWWRSFYGPQVAAFLYGIGLGAGFFTYLSFGTYAAVAAGAVASGSPAAGAALGLSFGVARGLSVLVSSRARDEYRAAEVAENLTAIYERGAPRAVNALALAAIAAAAFVTLW